MFEYFNLPVVGNSQLSALNKLSAVFLIVAVPPSPCSRWPPRAVPAWASCASWCWPRS